MEKESEDIIAQGIKSSADFIDARRIFHVYVTLLNFKRGSEASLLLIEDWIQRDSWINYDLLK